MAVMAIGVGSCSRLPDIRLFNDTGVPIILRMNMQRYAGDTRPPQYVQVLPGQSKTFMEYRLNPNPVIKSGGCDFQYVPLMSWANYNWGPFNYEYPIKLQLEPDMAVYFLPRKSKAIMPADQLSAVQAHGFPIRPVSKDCGPPPPAEAAAGLKP
jgi:hypothetical protein